MKSSEIDELIEEIIDENNDRALIILCSSIIDEQLHNILNKFLIDVPEKKEDLLKGDNPLSTFSSRIKILYRLGIIDDDFKSLLNTVRSVRNDCAHKIVININKSPIKDHILNIENKVKNKDSYDLVKKRFFNDPNINNSKLKSLFTTILIILESINKVITEITAEKKIIDICNK